MRIRELDKLTVVEFRPDGTKVLRELLCVSRLTYDRIIAKNVGKGFLIIGSSLHTSLCKLDSFGFVHEGVYPKVQLIEINYNYNYLKVIEVALTDLLYLARIKFKRWKYFTIQNRKAYSKKSWKISTLKQLRIFQKL